jgi:hypothetical protein
VSESKHTYVTTLRFDSSKTSSTVQTIVSRNVIANNTSLPANKCLFCSLILYVCMYVCMYVKFIYIAHLSCKHATNDAEVQSSVFGTTNFIGKKRY